MCGVATFACSPTAEIVVNSSTGFITVGTINQIRSVIISLDSNGKNELKEYTEEEAITIATQLNLYLPREVSSSEISFIVIGSIRITYLNKNGLTVHRDFLIEDANSFRDSFYPEVRYKSSISLMTK